MRRTRQATHLPFMYHIIMLNRNTINNSVLIFIVGKAGLLSLILDLSPGAISNISINRTIYWLDNKSARQIIFENMSKGQQLTALELSTADDVTTDTVTFILDNIQMTDAELDIVHDSILMYLHRRASLRVLRSQQQRLLMEYSKNTRQYASHQRVLGTFIESRGWAPLLNQN